MRKNRKVLLQGVGIGFILAGVIFYSFLNVTGYNHPEKSFESMILSNEEIIERAEDLGMIRLSDFLKGDYSDEDIEDSVDD